MLLPMVRRVAQATDCTAPFGVRDTLLDLTADGSRPFRTQLREMVLPRAIQAGAKSQHGLGCGGRTERGKGLDRRRALLHHWVVRLVRRHGRIRSGLQFHLHAFSDFFPCPRFARRATLIKRPALAQHRRS